MANDLRASIMDAAFEAGEAATNSVVTLTARLPILATCFFQPSPAALSEWMGAVGEKVGATFEGVAAAAATWQQATLAALFVPVTPTGVAHTAMAMARAASNPAHERVRANAIRLSGRG